jgi:enamine deaminase RidA (YjgF/YER057c/UK114 family)
MSYSNHRRLKANLDDMRTTRPAATTLLRALCLAGGVLAGCMNPQPRHVQATMKGDVQYLSPDGLHRNPAYSQVVVSSGNVKTVYVGGQNAVDASGNIVGKGDIKAQSERAIQNVQTALAAAGAKLEHVVKWNVYLVHGQALLPGFEAFQRAWGNRPNPPTVSVLVVAGLAHPDFLVEIDAIAVVPQP